MNKNINIPLTRIIDTQVVEKQGQKGTKSHRRIRITMKGERRKGREENEKKEEIKTLIIKYHTSTTANIGQTKVEGRGREKGRERGKERVGMEDGGGFHEGRETDGDI